MTKFSWTIGIGGIAVFFLGVATVMTLSINNTLSQWLGITVITVACVGLAVFVYQLVTGIFHTDTEGVERQYAGTAAFISLVTLGVGGVSYSLLEAFAGLPRLTAAVPAVAAGCVWMIVWAVLMHRDGAEE
jgi:hypothetical protein